MTSHELDRSPLQVLDESALKLILKTSQGFASPTSRARIKGPLDAKYISPSRAGHALSQHVRGAASTAIKTKFCSVDDMATALDLVLKSPVGRQTLARLAAAQRETLQVDLLRLFPIEAELDGIGTATFSTTDLRNVGILKIACVAVLEGRARGGKLYLHVQTLYPKLDPTQIERLFERLVDAKTFR